MKIKMMSTTMAKVMLVLLCSFVASTAGAQNRIDELVDNFSTVGSAKFTSVVDRDPKTRRIQKVVKKLEIRGPQAGKFRDAFRRESTTGSFTQQQDGDTETLTLTCESPRKLRIYMLQQHGRPVARSAKVIIIVKMRD